MTSNAAPDQSAIVLEVDRVEHGSTRLATQDLAPLAAGQVRLRINSFALTANNITYAVAGDMLGYWDFFPVDEDANEDAADGGPWGRVPAMGWADVIESANPDIAEGGRYYGWFPMGSHVTFDATATADGFRDDGAHRQAHASVYRGYTETGRDPWYDGAGDGEARHALLRGLFLTGFLAEEFFGDTTYFGAEQVVVMSASSKTAIGFAQRAAARGAVTVVGVTSAGNADFVRSVGFYDRVLTYDEVDELAVVPSVVIDMAGNSGALARVHARLGDQLTHSMMVGMSHHDATPTAIEHGPTPQMFFAPTEVSRRTEAWGTAGYRERTTKALAEFVAGSREWLTVQRTSGGDATQATWHAVRDGDVPPSVGRVTSLGDGPADDSHMNDGALTNDRSSGS